MVCQSMRLFAALLIALELSLVRAQSSNESSGQHRSPRPLGINQSTMTWTIYNFSTKTVFPQCVRSIVAGTACAGRRRRKRSFNYEDLRPIADLEAEGSIRSDPTTFLEGSKAIRDPRVFVTLWSSVIVTSTATITFLNTSSTLSLIYQCTGGNVEFPSQFSCTLG